MPTSFVIDPPPSPLPAAAAFLRQARFRLREDYLVKIILAMKDLSDDQIRWRPNASSNGIGNLIQHLCGNARQWIVAGVGGAADTRERAAEFDHPMHVDRDRLMALLERTLEDVDVILADLESAVIDTASESPLQRICTPQGFAHTVLDAIFHVVEHFSYHTGQIVMLAKWHAGDRIRLYDDARLNAGTRVP